MGEMEVNAPPRRRAAALLIVYLALALGACAFAAFSFVNYQRDTRGIEAPRTQPLTLGVNTELEQYTDPTQLTRAVFDIRLAGLTTIRQHFNWRDIETAPGVYDWSRYDNLVELAESSGLDILPVLDTTPAFYQRTYERANPYAPPDDFSTFAQFAAAFAAHYQFHQYEIWDQPNVYPNWGERNANPAEYARLLHVAAQALRASDPGSQIIVGGLAMNLEKERDKRNYSEVLFLRGLYDAGAQNDFDAVAIKPYGLWTGPDDRRVSLDVLNFSRAILMREEMRAHNDSRPLIAVEFGWNALPPNWQGQPSPWGSDSAEIQVARTQAAIARVRDEWSWMPTLYAATLQPHAPADDPRWGFALLDAHGQPTAFYDMFARVNQAALVPSPLPDRIPFYVGVVLLVGVALGAGWRAVVFAARLRLRELWRAVEENFRALPELAQLSALAFAVAAFYYAPRTDLTFVLLLALVPLFAFRLDLALVLTVFTIPFYLEPKNLFSGFALSLTEILTLVGVVAFIIKWVMGEQDVILSGAKNLESTPGDSSSQKTLLRMTYLSAIRYLLSAISGLDYAIIAFVVLALATLPFAGNFGVANRDFRVVVLDPALFYFLVRFTRRDQTQSYRLVYALIASALVVAAIGLYQFFFTGDVIAAEGISRVHAVWASPNNAALFLGRILPLTLVLALFANQRMKNEGGEIKGKVRIFNLQLSTFQLFNTLASLILLVVLYLTYSRGALLVGVPASLLFIAALRGRRARMLVLGGLVVGALALIPFSFTERFQSFFQAGTGTGFFRVSVWTSALNMIRDHPLVGVGLDNFLYEYPKYILPDAWREPNLSHPHNLILDWWTSLGVLGVVVLAWFEVEFFRRGWRVYHGAADYSARVLALALMASMVDFLAHGMIDAAYFLPDLAFVFMLTLALVQGLELSD